MQLPNIRINKKIIIGIIAVAVIAEGIWAYRVLLGNQPAPGVSLPTTPAVKIIPTASVTLEAPKTVMKVGEKILVTINISSPKVTDGTDLIIKYDSSLISVVPDKSGSPVAVASIYSDYPINSLDEKLGQISVSGISSQQGGVKPEGIFGTITFKAQKAGQAKVSLDFTKGSTIDSNVIEAKTAQDILGTVKNVELNITP
ncbi:MAG: cohesin domain-containing protein [Candidatus Daviesbacteria bacterium]